MIKHIVFWKFKDHAEGSDKAVNLVKAKALLDGCAQVVPGILGFEVAIAKANMDCTRDLVLYSEFTDRAALDAYQSHPQHLAVKPFIGSVSLERQCMDYEI